MINYYLDYQYIRRLSEFYFRKKIHAIFYRTIDKVMKFLDTFGNFTAMQTCCTYKVHPCGDPNCQIRVCVKEKEYRTCAECSDYQTCSKLDFLKPHHKTLISDLDYIKENGFDKYSKEIVGKFQLPPISID